MKKTRLIIAASLLTIGTFATVGFSSCSKDNAVCPVGYTGKDCKGLVRDNFVGAWTGSDICTSGTYSINLTVSASSASGINAIVNNPGGFGGTVAITGTVVSDTELDFTNQDVGGSRTLSGKMVFTGNNMAFSYTVTGVATTDNCSGNYARQ